jgi:hypothetical protein
MDEQPRDRSRHGPGWTVPAVLLILVVLLVVAMFRREDAEPPQRPPMQPAASTFLDCTDCHGDLDRVFKAGELPTLLFTHEKHFGIGVSDCAACHVANTHEKDKVNVPKMTTCYQCHSTRAGAQAPGNCTLCHPPNLNPEPKSHLADNWVSQLHPDAAKENPFDCTSCHEQSFCDSCHGLPLPHPSRFAERTHAVTFFEDPGLCETCHPRQPLTGRGWCDSCHHPQGPDSTTWIDWHPNVVSQRGAETCFQCHATDTCRICHRQGPENFTDADLQADEALLTGGVTPGVTTTPSTPTPTPSPSA